MIFLFSLNTWFFHPEFPLSNEAWCQLPGELSKRNCLSPYIISLYLFLLISVYSFLPEEQQEEYLVLPRLPCPVNNKIISRSVRNSIMATVATKLHNLL